MLFLLVLLCAYAHALVLRRDEVASFECVGGDACGEARHVQLLRCETPPPGTVGLSRCDSDDNYQWVLTNVSVHCDTRFEHLAPILHTCAVSFALSRRATMDVLRANLCGVLRFYFNALAFFTPLWLPNSVCDAPTTAHNGVVALYASQATGKWEGAFLGALCSAVLCLLGVLITDDWTSSHRLMRARSVALNDTPSLRLPDAVKLTEWKVYVPPTASVATALQRALDFCRRGAAPLAKRSRDASFVGVQTRTLPSDPRLLQYTVTMLLYRRELDAVWIAELGAVHPDARWTCGRSCSPDHLLLELSFAAPLVEESK
jgi:hypothetical protein